MGDGCGAVVHVLDHSNGEVDECLNDDGLGCANCSLTFRPPTLAPLHGMRYRQRLAEDRSSPEVRKALVWPIEVGLLHEVRRFTNCPAWSQGDLALEIYGLLAFGELVVVTHRDPKPL